MDIQTCIKDHLQALKDCDVNMQEAKDNLIKIIDDIIKGLEED